MQKIIAEIKQNILQWNETSIGNGDFGARTFLFHNEEFGHIHQNGDLDIDFGNNLTGKLLQKQLVQKHLYIPESCITYKVKRREDISFAISLLRFSYLVKANERNAISNNIFENELTKLPEILSSIYLN